MSPGNAARRGMRRSPAWLAALDAPAARALFECDSKARLAVDGDGRVLRANPALALLAGHAPGDLLVDLLPAVPQAKLEALLGGTPLACLLARGGGAPRPVRIAALPMPGGGAMLAVEPEPPSEAAAVRAARLEAVGALAGGIAHDFNNLLQAIGAAAEALAEVPALTGADRDDLARIAGGVRRGADLVRQLLAFSRQQTLLPRPVAVNPAVADLAVLLRRTLGERVRLEMRLEEPGRHVLIDPGQFDQVLLNLAVNARDAMPQGGTLTLATGRRTVLSHTRIGEETQPPGRYVVIEVADTGQGIAPDVLPRIFEPFFTTKPAHAQGSVATPAPGSGAGLGLSTVHGIIRQSGGFIEVESVPGQGARFRLMLPRCDPSGVSADIVSAKPSRGEHALAVPGAPGAILLVEDEEPVRRLATRALARQGWQVLAAESGEAALALLKAQSAIACIVTDLVMPGMDGAALVRAARAQLGKADLPAIVVSGYAEADSRVAVGSLEAAFLSKPYALRELAARVATLAGGGRTP